MSRLKSKTETMIHDYSKFSQLKNSFEKLLDEVRRHEGTFADCNLAMDNARSGIDADEMLQYQKSAKNKQLAKEVDHLFLSKQKLEKIFKK